MDNTCYEEGNIIEIRNFIFKDDEMLDTPDPKHGHPALILKADKDEQCIYVLPLTSSYKQFKKNPNKFYRCSKDNLNRLKKTSFCNLSTIYKFKIPPWNERIVAFLPQYDIMKIMKKFKLYHKDSYIEDPYELAVEK